MSLLAAGVDQLLTRWWWQTAAHCPRVSGGCGGGGAGSSTTNEPMDPPGATNPSPCPHFVPAARLWLLQLTSPQHTLLLHGCSTLVTPYLNPVLRHLPAAHPFSGGKATAASADTDAATAPRRVAAAGGSKLNMVGTSLRPRPEMMGATLGYSR